MKRCFNENEIRLRMEELPDADLGSDIGNDELGYWESFSNPAVR